MAADPLWQQVERWQHATVPDSEGPTVVVLILLFAVTSAVVTTTGSGGGGHALQLPEFRIALDCSVSVHELGLHDTWEICTAPPPQPGDKCLQIDQSGRS